MLENIVKFAITNHIGGLYGGMTIECRGVDKMSDLKLGIDYDPMYNGYIIKVHYWGRGGKNDRTRKESY